MRKLETLQQLQVAQLVDKRWKSWNYSQAPSFSPQMLNSSIFQEKPSSFLCSSFLASYGS